MHDHAYLNALNLIPGVGPQKLRLMITHCTTAEIAWHASHSDLVESGLSDALAQTVVREQSAIDVVREWEKLEKEKMTLLTITDPDFPKLLKKIPNPPFLLYVRGNKKVLQTPTIAIVGARKFSTYGKQACYKLAFDLAQAGITVISGLALGIDAIAHRSALDAHGATIGVLGGSIDDLSITPRSNVVIAREIIDHSGALLSEYPVPTQPSKGTFPARNRIMAGMACATLVIEAAEHSGTLITANLATKFERKLFAVPGSIFAQQSYGTHKLIASGNAQIVQNAQQIIDDLDLAKNNQPAQERTITADSPAEQEVLNLLMKNTEGISIDRIIRITTLDATDASSTLILMEMKGMIKNIDGQKYILL